MKRAIVYLLIFFSTPILAQHHGLGFKVGEPSGITLKFYLPNSKAIEAVFGTGPKKWDQNYYSNSFKERYKDFSSTDIKVRNIMYAQLRYVIHHHINTEGIDGKLDWYWGVGAAYKKADTRYIYFIEGQNPKNVYSLTRTDIDFGPELIGGLEYNMQNAPIAVFMELNGLFEFSDRVTQRIVGGIGMRYNF